MPDPRRPVTIRDVAAHTGLSIATVSLALRDHPRISRQTRQKVAESARQLGYRANPMMAAHWETVRARKNPRFQSVIAVINDWETNPRFETYPWLAPTYSAMSSRAQSLGYLIEEFSIAAEDHPGRLARLASMVRVLRARGIFAIASLFSAHPRVFVDSMDLLEEFATVFACAEYKHVEHTMSELRRMPFHRANPDHYGNMLALLDALKAEGYCRPGFWPNSWAEARTGGENTAAFNFWIQSLPAADQLPVKWTRWEVDPPLEQSRRAFLKWLPAKKPDVVICQRFEVREWIESLGLKIPGDIGLAHTDLGPPEHDWSGIDARLDHVAAAAIELLTAHLQRNERGVPEVPKDVRLEGRWIARSTTRQGGE